MDVTAPAIQPVMQPVAVHVKMDAVVHVKMAVEVDAQPAAVQGAPDVQAAPVRVLTAVQVRVTVVKHIAQHGAVPTVAENVPAAVLGSVQQAVPVIAMVRAIVIAKVHAITAVRHCVTAHVMMAVQVTAKVHAEDSVQVHVPAHVQAVAQDSVPDAQAVRVAQVDVREPVAVIAQVPAITNAGAATVHVPALVPVTAKVHALMNVQVGAAVIAAAIA